MTMIKRVLEGAPLVVNVAVVVVVALASLQLLEGRAVAALLALQTARVLRNTWMMEMAIWVV